VDFLDGGFLAAGFLDVCGLIPGESLKKSISEMSLVRSSSDSSSSSSSEDEERRSSWSCGLWLRIFIGSYLCTLHVDATERVNKRSSYRAST
jgi:hypothetical protein